MIMKLGRYKCRELSGLWEKGQVQKEALWETQCPLHDLSVQVE
jgi:hypothetical protein